MIAASDLRLVSHRAARAQYDFWVGSLLGGRIRKSYVGAKIDGCFASFWKEGFPPSE